MPDKTVAQKLLIKENYKIFFMNEPDNYRAILGELPEKLNEIKPRMSPKGLLWVTYPKGTSGIKTDINRDIIRLKLSG